MQVGNRLFPYPILNSDPALSSYQPGCMFLLYYDDEIVGDDLVLQDIHCSVQSNFLQKLLAEDKAEIKLLVEFPQALYRQTFTITTEPDKIVIPCAEICGQYNFSAFIVAKEDISVDGDIDEFVDEYSGLTFVFEKHDILAVDEGHKRSVVFDLGDDMTKSSIFVVAMDKTLEKGCALYEYDNNQIEILLDENSFNSYNDTKNGSLKRIYHALMAVPALTYCIQQLLLKSRNDIQETINEANIDYNWFASFYKSFNKKFGRDFGESDIDNLADDVQKLFDYPTGEGIVILHDLTTEGEDEDED